LVQIAKRRQPGKGLAIAGVAVSAVSGVLVMAFVIASMAGAFDSDPERDGDGNVVRAGSAAVHEIAKGDCFDTGQDLADLSSGQLSVERTVKLVPCSEPHDAEAYAVVPLSGDVFPGDALTARLAEQTCAPEVEKYMRDAWAVDPALGLFYYYPRAVNWAQGERRITCVKAIETETRLLEAHPWSPNAAGPVADLVAELRRSLPSWQATADAPDAGAFHAAAAGFDDVHALVTRTRQSLGLASTRART
jgi:hypothetical protein